MDLMKVPRRDKSISQFARANCYELSGRTLELAMDDGYDIVLMPEDGACAWRRAGGEEGRAAAMCFKADDTTYLLTFDVSERENHSYALDFEQRLVTRVVCRKGVHPANYHIMQCAFTFGAIRVRGYKLPYKRHTFTGEHLGTTVKWRWSPEMFTLHAYLQSSWYRITWDDEGRAAADFGDTNEMLPSTDEHAAYVKIKDRMFLFAVTEETEERLLGDIQTFRCDNLLLLQNYDRMIQVGRGFGDAQMPGETELRHIFVPLAAFGSPVELPERFLNADNPYTV